MMRFDTEMICIFRPKFRVKDGTKHAPMRFSGYGLKDEGEEGERSHLCSPTPALCAFEHSANIQCHEQNMLARQANLAAGRLDRFFKGVFFVFFLLVIIEKLLSYIPAPTCWQQWAGSGQEHPCAQVHFQGFGALALLGFSRRQTGGEKGKGADLCCISGCSHRAPELHARTEPRDLQGQFTTP